MVAAAILRDAREESPGFKGQGAGFRPKTTHGAPVQRHSENPMQSLPRAVRHWPQNVGASRYRPTYAERSDRSPPPPPISPELWTSLLEGECRLPEKFPPPPAGDRLRSYWLWPDCLSQKKRYHCCPPSPRPGSLRRLGVPLAPDPGHPAVAEPASHRSYRR